MSPGRVGLTCRHDITPRSACKLCKAEDDLMRRPRQPPKAKLSAKEKHKLLVEMNRRILAEDEKNNS